MHSDEHVKQVCDELNARPRKSLDYLSPAAALRAEYKIRAGLSDAYGDLGAG